MNGKVVLITGASGGLGNSVSRRFLASGAIVIGASRKITTDEFPSANFVAMPVDFSNKDATRAAVDTIVQKYGRLDALIHVLGGFAGGRSVAAVPMNGSTCDESGFSAAASCAFTGAIDIAVMAIRNAVIIAMCFISIFIYHTVHFVVTTNGVMTIYGFF